MKQIAFTLAALAVMAAPATAQDMYTNAKNKALAAKAASDAHTEAMQKPEAGAAKAPAQSAKAPAKGTANSAAPAASGGRQLAVATRDTAGPPATLYREAYDYTRDGRRDPFISLLTTNELRPTMSDLRLTGVLYDHSGRNSLATLRDLTTNAQYRVTVGSTLGRMRIAAIRTTSVIFTIDEFGTTRRDSLVLRDSTNKGRGK